jgi:23S rRNA (cytosine1962-C5)-methyltransferase
MQFGVSFDEGYSVGLFLDQRDNRRRLLVNHIAAGFPIFESAPEGAQVLNTFSYTCAFSVCAAKAGANTTSLDLSKKYLQWGQRNFQLNQISPAEHDFIYGDVFDWMKRLAKKKRLFDLVILDPPTFSRSKEHGVFQVEKDYPGLVKLALPLLRKDGVLFASTNFAGVKAEVFVERLTEAIRSGGRTILKQHYAPQPPDFPISKAEPAYLKTVWMRLG